MKGESEKAFEKPFQCLDSLSAISSDVMNTAFDCPVGQNVKMRRQDSKNTMDHDMLWHPSFIFCLLNFFLSVNFRVFPGSSQRPT